MAKIRVGGLGRLLMIVVIVVVGLVVAFVPALSLPPFVGAGVYGVGGRGVSVSVSVSSAGYVDDPRVAGYGDDPRVVGYVDLYAVGYGDLDAAVRYRGLDAVGDRDLDAVGYGAGGSGREAGAAAGEGPVVGDAFGHPHAAREGCPARRGGRSTGSLCAPVPSGKAVSTAAPVGTVQGGSAISAPLTGRQAVPLSRSGELPVHHLVFRC